jgi:hypothetical protein
MRFLSKQHWPVSTAILLLSSSFVFGQALGQPSPTLTPTSGLAEIDTLIKIVAALITGIATLIGLPIVFLTYRKTRAEITKLELEANSLRQKQDAQPALKHDDEGNIRIVVDNSPHSNIHVLGDPRFLAPLLILLDFIFAWIVLTMAGYLLSIFGFSVLRTFVLTVLSGLLLIPIARQVLRVRAVLRPPNTEAEVRASQRQVRVVAYAVYASVVASSLVFGAIMLLLGQDNLTQLGRYLAWALIVLGLLLIIALPLIMRRLNLYLARLHEQDTQLRDKSEA